MVRTSTYILSPHLLVCIAVGFVVGCSGESEQSGGRVQDPVTGSGEQGDGTDTATDTASDDDTTSNLPGQSTDDGADAIPVDSSLREACTVGTERDDTEDCGFVVGNLCFESAEAACDCEGCGLDSCLQMESYPVQVRCDTTEVDNDHGCDEGAEYYEPGCDEGMPAIEAGCFTPCRDESDTSCGDGQSCTMVSINPCVCAEGEICCSACGAQAYVCL